MDRLHERQARLFQARAGVLHHRPVGGASGPHPPWVITRSRTPAAIAGTTTIRLLTLRRPGTLAGPRAGTTGLPGRAAAGTTSWPGRPGLAPLASPRSGATSGPNARAPACARASNSPPGFDTL